MLRDKGHCERQSEAIIRGHQSSSELISLWSSEVINGHQRTSVVIRGHQRSSVVIWPRTLTPMGASGEASVQMPHASIVACHEHLIVPDEGGHQRGHQSSSVVISCNQQLSELIRAHQRSSVAISGYQSSSELIRGHPRSSEAIRGYHQSPSEVIRGHKWS
jgi:hypothetical protein